MSALMTMIAHAQDAWMMIPMAISAVGSVMQGQSQAAAYEGQATAQKYQAKLDKINAGMAYAQGSAAEEAKRREWRQKMGEARAAAAQSGVGLEGTNADWLAQSYLNAELDALNIRYDADVTAQGYLNQAQGEKYNASLSKNAASSARTSGYLAGASAIAGGMAGNYTNTGNVWGKKA